MSNSSSSKNASKMSNYSNSNNSNSMATEQMKYEIANEFGVELGADATARQNGSVGGEITRRLVRMAKSNLDSGK